MNETETDTFLTWTPSEWNRTSKVEVFIIGILSLRHQKAELSLEYEQ